MRTKKRCHLRGGPILCTDFSILSAKGFRWVGGSGKPVRKDCRISITRPLKGSSIKTYGFFYLHKLQIRADPPTHPSICITARKKYVHLLDFHHDFIALWYTTDIQNT